MEDRHSAEISSAIRSLSGAIHTLAWLLFMGLMYNGCMASMAHH